MNSSSETDRDELATNEVGDSEIMRQLPQLGWEIESISWLLMSVAAIALSAYIILYAYSPFLLKGHFTVLVILLSFVAFFLFQITTRDREQDYTGLYTVFQLGLIGVSAITFGYFFFAYKDLLDRLLLYNQFEYLLAAVIILVALEGTRQTYGVALTAIITATLVYAHFGPYLPGLFHHEGLAVKRILEVSVLTLDGVFGFIPKIGATWVAIFLIYGGLLEAYGAQDVFSKVGRIMSSRVSSGVAQFAVVTSAFMGMITGVSAANTATTGSFTIPLMKRNGLRGTTAGAIESVASSGGQVMPPIMGASAFVMASMLSVSYVRILKAALLPAALYYVSLAIVVHVTSINQGISLEFDKTEDTGIMDAIPIAVSIFLLVYFIAWLRFGPMQSAFYAITSLTVLQFITNTREGADRTTAIYGSVRETLTGLQIAGMTVARLMPAIIGVAVMVEMIQVGSLVQKITFLMLDLSSGQLIPLLVLAMVLSILLGMGAPTIVAYIVVSTMVGPAVVEFGIPQLHGHLFAFYFAVLSAITPPFAVACLVASGISESSFLRTCKEAVKLALPIYLLPYAFVVHPNLVVWDANTPLTFGLVFLGLLGTILGVTGYPDHDLPLPARGVALLSGMAILLSNIRMFNAAGAVVLLVILVYLIISNRSLSAIPASR